MKLIFCTIVGLLLSIIGHDQSITRSFTVCDKSFNSKLEAKENGGIEVSIWEGLVAAEKAEETPEPKKIVYTIWPADFKIFSTQFSDNLSKSFEIGTQCIEAATTVQNKLETFATELFFGYQASQAASDAQPVAGIFKAYDSVDIYFEYWAKDTAKAGKTNKENKKSKSNWVKYYSESMGKVSILAVSAEINESYMENIKVIVELWDKKPMTFTLPYAIGISTISNFRSYFTRQLFSMDSPIYPKKPNNSKKSKNNLNKSFYILLGKAINYDYKHGVERRDFSPLDMTFELKGGESMALHKEKTNRLFEAHVFTDFVGLQQEKPNGLIQTEIRKRINVNSKQFLIKWPGLRWAFKSVAPGQYIMPAVTLSKIEEHNKRFTLGNLDSIRNLAATNPPNTGTDISKFRKDITRYASLLELYRYQMFSGGATANLLYLSNHSLKYSLEINFGFRIGITQITDSLTKAGSGLPEKTGFANHYTINNLQFFPEIKWRFLPEERFNFSITNQYILLKPVADDIQIVKTYKGNPAVIYPIKSGWINAFELLMALKINKESGAKLFGRLRFNSVMGNVNQNFAQVQLGFSTFILGKQ